MVVGVICWVAGKRGGHDVRQFGGYKGRNNAVQCMRQS